MGSICLLLSSFLARLPSEVPTPIMYADTCSPPVSGEGGGPERPLAAHPCPLLSVGSNSSPGDPGIAGQSRPTALPGCEPCIPTPGPLERQSHHTEDPRVLPGIPELSDM